MPPRKTVKTQNKQSDEVVKVIVSLVDKFATSKDDEIAFSFLCAIQLIFKSDSSAYNMIDFLCENDFVFLLMRFAKTHMSRQMEEIEGKIFGILIWFLDYIGSSSRRGTCHVVKAGCLHFLRDVLDLIEFIEPRVNIPLLRHEAVHLIDSLVNDSDSLSGICKQMGFVRQIGDLILNVSMDHLDLINCLCVIDSMVQNGGCCVIDVFRDISEIACFVLKNSSDSGVLVQNASILAHLGSEGPEFLTIILENDILSYVLDLLQPNDKFTDMMRLRLLHFIGCVLSHGNLVTRDVSDRTERILIPMLGHHSPVIRIDVVGCYKKTLSSRLSRNESDLSYIQSLFENGAFSRFIKMLINESDQFVRAGVLLVVIMILRHCSDAEIRYASSEGLTEGLCAAFGSKRPKKDWVLAHEGLNIISRLDDDDFNRETCRLINQYKEKYDINAGLYHCESNHDWNKKRDILSRLREFGS